MQDFQAHTAHPPASAAGDFASPRGRRGRTGSPSAASRSAAAPAHGSSRAGAGTGTYAHPETAYSAPWTSAGAPPAGFPAASSRGGSSAGASSAGAGFSSASHRPGAAAPSRGREAETPKTQLPAFVIFSNIHSTPTSGGRECYQLVFSGSSEGRLALGGAIQSYNDRLMGHESGRNNFLDHVTTSEAKYAITDTAGQERFRSLLTGIYKTAHAVFLFGSPTDNPDTLIRSNQRLSCENASGESDYYHIRYKRNSAGVYEIELLPGDGNDACRTLREAPAISGADLGAAGLSLFKAIRAQHLELRPGRATSAAGTEARAGAGAGSWAPPSTHGPGTARLFAQGIEAKAEAGAADDATSGFKCTIQ